MASATADNVPGRVRGDVNGRNTLLRDGRRAPVSGAFLFPCIARLQAGTSPRALDSNSIAILWPILLTACRGQSPVVQLDCLRVCLVDKPQDRFLRFSFAMFRNAFYASSSVFDRLARVQLHRAFAASRQFVVRIGVADPNVLDEPRAQEFAHTKRP